MNALSSVQLMNPAAIGQGVQNAFEQGRQRKEQENAKNALSQYAVNPDSEENFANLARYQPQLAIQERGRRDKAQQEQQMVQLRQRALQGDEQAQMQLATIDTDAYNRMDTQQRAEVDKTDDALAEAMFAVVQLPEDQRGQAWDYYAEQLGRPDYKGQYSPQMMNIITARQGIQERFQKFQQPNYTPVGEGGLAGFQYGQPMQGGANMAPQGAPQQPGMAPADAGPILQQAQATGAITAEDAQRVQSSLGPQGAQQFEQWKSQNGIRVIARTGTDASGRKVVQFEDGTVDYAD